MLIDYFSPQIGLKRHCMMLTMRKVRQREDLIRHSTKEFRHHLARDAINKLKSRSPQRFQRILDM
jgi:hypothetical protein